MSSEFRQFEAVCVAAMRDVGFSDQAPVFQRNPRVGDLGTVLQVYRVPEMAYEVECSDPTTGETVCLEAMYPEELQSIQGKAAALGRSSAASLADWRISNGGYHSPSSELALGKRHGYGHLFR